MSREYNIKPAENPAQVGDAFRYSNGNEYIITEAGPVVMGTCFECGAPAGATFETKLNSIRCSACWSKQHGLLPGQDVYEAKAAYAAAFRAARPTRAPRSGPRRP